MKCRLDEISDGAIKDGRRIDLPDGRSGTLAATFGVGDRVHVVLITDGAYTTTEALPGEQVATITKEE